MGLGETVEPVGYGEGFVFRGGDLMTTRTGTVEDASKKDSVFCIFQVMLKGDLRSIGRDSARYFELDGIGFFMKGFELGNKVNSAKNIKGML